MRIVLYGNPVTKKNSQRLITARGHPVILPSKAFMDYQDLCLAQLHGTPAIDGTINLKCVYFMQTRRKVDLVNLLEGTCDILVKAEILPDDNCTVIASVDGSEVRYDKTHPRAEIEIVQKAVKNAL